MEFIVDLNGKIYDCKWNDDTDFESLEKVNGAHGFVFDDDGNMIILNFTEKDRCYGVIDNKIILDISKIYYGNEQECYAYIKKDCTELELNKISFEEFAK
jgi:hypothetical protein